MDIKYAVSKTVEVICYSSCLLEGYFIYGILCNMLRKKKGILWTIMIYISCSVLSAMIIFAGDMFNITLDLLWFIVLMLLAFHGRVIPKLATVAVLYPMIIAQNFLVMDVLGQYYLYSGKSFFADIFCSLTDASLHVLFWFIIRRFFSRRLSQIDSLFDDKTWALLGTVCFASMVSITTCIYFAPKETWKIWLCAVSCIVTNVGSLFLADYFANSIRSDMERKNLKLQQDYYKELEQNQLQIRKFRHDMNNHLGIIRSLFDAGDREEAEKYFQEIEAQMAAKNRVFCKNSIVNAVLNAKYNMALQHNIDCFFHIDLQNMTGIDSVSLCSLFANTLDNAIEASLKIPEVSKRKISVRARVTDNGFFSYEISNTKINPVSEKKGRFFSDKEDSKSHGLGLSNVQDIVKRYGGMLDISHDAENFTVTVLIGDVI